jgi:SAM-dependent methyltransferase
MVRPRPGEAVLDVACGTGLVTVRAARLVGSGGRVVGTDLSDRMVEATLAAATTNGASVRATRMDAENLEFDDQSFDAALCALGLMYMPDPERCVQELHRVLRAGGRAGAAVWGQRARCGWAEIFPIVDARVSSEVCPLFFRLGSGDSLVRAFRSAGFVDVACSRLETTLWFASGEDACLACFVGGPVALAYDRFDEATRRDVHAEYLASIEPYRRGASYAIPGEFVVVAGNRRDASTPSASSNTH